MWPTNDQLTSDCCFILHTFTKALPIMQLNVWMYEEITVRGIVLFEEKQVVVYEMYRKSIKMAKWVSAGSIER